MPRANRSLSGRRSGLSLIRVFPSSLPCVSSMQNQGTLHAMHVPELSSDSHFGEPTLLATPHGHGAPVAVRGMAPGPLPAALGRDAAGWDWFRSDRAAQPDIPPVGARCFSTRDDSGNHWGGPPCWAGGEGWHNNHHAHPVPAAHRMAWRKVDVSSWGIRWSALPGPGKMIKGMCFKATRNLGTAQQATIASHAVRR